MLWCHMLTSLFHLSQTKHSGCLPLSTLECLSATLPKPIQSLTVHEHLFVAATGRILEGTSLRKKGT